MPQLKDVGNFLEKLAPTIAGLVGGPLASSGVQALEGVLGLAPSPGASVDSRVTALMSSLQGMTPDQIIAVKQADNAIKAKLLDGGVQLEQIYGQDRVSARGMETVTKDPTPRILATLIVIACAAVAFAVFSGYSPAVKDPAVAGMAGTIIGYLFSELKAVFAFYFGSSAGSEAKNDMLNKALNS